jgi:HAD superfamily hydrolase (TIGR01456 family)
LTPARYGFKNVVTPGDILTAHPNIWPFSSLHAAHYASISKPLPPGPLKIDAIFVFSDPHDWALDTQIILDLLLSSNGVLNTYSAKNGDKSLPNNGWLQDGQPNLIFSNPDLFWAASHELPRLGQGGFRSAFQGVWDEVTDGAELTKLVMGKPTRQTYLYSERMLQKHRAELLSALHEEVGELKQVFMIGDNPESDIRGANDFESPHGTSWDSVLVKTGVWQEGKPLKYKPKIIVDNVQEAVKWGLKKQGYAHDEAEFSEK